MTVPEWIEAHFDRCAPWLAAALDECPIRTHELPHVREALDAGRAQLWPTANSAVVTTISEHPTGIKTMCLWLGGGDLGEIQRTVAQVASFARSEGCAHLTIQGRKGWARALPGFRAASTLVYKDLGE